MKILLISPPYNIIRQAYGSKSKVSYGNIPPLGIAYVAGALLKAGHSVQIIDSPALGIDNGEVVSRARDFAPDMIGISALTASSKAAYSLADELRAALKTPIVIGGAHAISFPEECLKNCASIDVSVYSEGEAIAAALAESISDPAKLAAVPGICYRAADGKITQNGPPVCVENLDDLPTPAWQLYDFSLYRSLPLQYRKLPMTSFITSRGCFWRKCAFCYQAGRASATYRRYSPARAAREIELLVNKFGIREVMFWDDTFAVNEKWISDFCAELKNRGVDIPWSCYGRVNTVTPGMLKMMKAAGCWNIFFGYESGNQELLDRMHKGITLAQSESATRWAKEAGLSIRGSFMLALPGETPEMGRKTVDFAVSLGLSYAQFLPTHPEFGTELYEQALKDGKITAAVNYSGRMAASFVPDAYGTKEAVEKMVKYAYRRFYFHPGYVIRFLSGIRGWEDIKSIIDGLRFFFGMLLSGPAK
jgi:anaerobic magnesium-protoporphyrin IX monomethyl ester cyclase